MSKGRFCVIKNNYRIKCELENAFNDKSLLNTDVVEDAKAHGRKIDAGMLSRYMNSFDEYGRVKPDAEDRLSAENILWLCARWGVNVTIDVRPLKTKGEKELLERAKNFNPYTYT